MPGNVDVVVLGAGAAGLMAAASAGGRGRRVLLLDHADRPGKKILISGGGRANFTNLGCGPENFLCGNPHFARSALSRFTPADMVALVEKHGVPYHEKMLGQLFCDRSARDLLELLLRECAEARVVQALETRVLQVSSTPAGGFALETSRGTVRAGSVIVATGGLSIPKIGATGFGYELARQFGLQVIAPRPALVPLTLAAEDLVTWSDLAGVAAEVVARVPAVSTGRRESRTPEFREKLLFTHRGLSGPAVLQISSYWRPGERVGFDLVPGQSVTEPLLAPRARRDRAAAALQLRTVLPARLAERLLDVALATAPETRDLSNATLRQLEDQLHCWSVSPAGSEGFSKAEVTAGGVDTAELDPRTLESRKVPGLYFVGEVVDVTGWLGGYNFQWAWASGFCAGQAA